MPRLSVANFANSLNFDGVSGKELDIGTDVYNFERTDSFSWSFYVAFRTISATRILGGEWKGSPFQGWHSRISGGLFRNWLIGSAGAGSSLYVDFIPPLLNRWTLVTVTYDGSSTVAGFKCYYNNVLQTAEASAEALATSINAASQGMKWGAWSGAATNVLDGLITHMRVFDYELTTAQVADLYFNHAVTGTAALDEYLCTEGSGASVASTGSSANAGTLSGVVWDSANVPRGSRSAITTNRTALS
tara:strand:+ start:2035 stop:2772 length:738 start_codon:yes stop_codon:yes gene_type:complete